LKDKVAIITGASSGIGLECAKYFSKKGMKLALAARSADKLNKLVEEIKTSGGEAIAIQTDVTVVKDCERMVDETLKAFGRIDVLVNNAGISMRDLFIDTEIEVFQRLIETNLMSAIYCTKFALPHLLKTKGSVVGVSSIAGYHGLPGRTAYSASKYGLQGFLDALRSENRETGLHVLVACPGFTASNIRNSALKGDGTLQKESPRIEEKMMQPDDVARKIYNGIVKRKRRVIMTFEGWSAVYIGVNLPALTEKVIYNKMKAEPDSPWMMKKWEENNPS
jgi:dehydrogenase/reductase SDR family protein 7B